MLSVFSLCEMLFICPHFLLSVKHLLTHLSIQSLWEIYQPLWRHMMLPINNDNVFVQVLGRKMVAAQWIVYWRITVSNLCKCSSPVPDFACRCCLMGGCFLSQRRPVKRLRKRTLLPPPWPFSSQRCREGRARNPMELPSVWIKWWRYSQTLV